MDCQNIHYASINNHFDCFVHYFSSEHINNSIKLDDYILTSLAEHKHYKIIDYYLEQQLLHNLNPIHLNNEKFIRFLKQYNINDIQDYPFLKQFFNSLTI
jgi:hypothetical protein